MVSYVGILPLQTLLVFETKKPTTLLGALARSLWEKNLIHCSPCCTPSCLVLFHAPANLPARPLRYTSFNPQTFFWLQCLQAAIKRSSLQTTTLLLIYKKRSNNRTFKQLGAFMTLVGWVSGEDFWVKTTAGR